MWTVSTILQIRDHRRNLQSPVAFVPTMGALHQGHVSLMQAARKLTGNVIVSIFVNPTQFGPTEDFKQYPRPLEKDLELCSSAGVTGVFCPTAEEMYPADQIPCSLDMPALHVGLEDKSRPGHFQGVCRVVAKFFNIVEPSMAIFGQKDYQQLKIIQAMAADLAMPVQVIGLPTVREPDGLAMSSRNRHLDPSNRRHAIGLYKALSESKQMVEQQGETDPAAVESAMRSVLAAHHIQVDYAVIRHPHTLASIDCIAPSVTGGVVALIAGRLGNVRLIDNMLLGTDSTANMTN